MVIDCSVDVPFLPIFPSFAPLCMVRAPDETFYAPFLHPSLTFIIFIFDATPRSAQINYSMYLTFNIHL